jgi:hypothetical protein
MSPGFFDILRFIAATAGLIVGPVLLAIVIGLIQLALYKTFRKAGWIADSDIPMFPILVLRGMFVALGVIAAVVFYLRFELKEPGFPSAPPKSETARSREP